MHRHDPNFDAELDAELRSVPLPKRLVKRLRRAALVDDGGLDAALRYVAVPAGLIEKLQQAALVDDEGLDETLRRVALPVGLTDRLRRAVLIDDEGLDTALRDVPVPLTALERLRRIPKHRLRMLRASRWATAASLLVSIGVAYLGAMIVLLWMLYPADRASSPELATWTIEPAEMSAEMGPPLDIAMTAEFEDIDPELIADVMQWLRDFERIAWRQWPDDPLDSSLPDRTNGPLDPLPEVVRDDRPGDRPGDRLDEGDFWPDSDKVLLGGPGLDPLDGQPELEKVAGLKPRGIDPPLVSAFPLHFYRRFGVHPFVSPAADTRLQTSVVPLGIDTASYELTRRYLRGGERPPAGDVRTEEFLAAMDYDLPRPKNEPLKLFTALGPSPFPGDSLCLLQVGVRARAMDRHRDRPVHVVLAVDTSGSMRWGGRLDMVRRAVEKLATALGPEDRISVVTFSNEAQLLIENAGRDDAEDLVAAIGSLSTQTSTRLGVGLRSAYEVAHRSAASDRATSAVRVVVLSDGLAELAPGAASLLKRRLAESAQQEILCEVIDLGRNKQADPQLTDLAVAGGGSVHRAANANEIYWALIEVVTGYSQIVAHDARLEVHFNPDRVLDYRLLGHEAESMVGLDPPSPEADFHADQTSCALYEIRLKTGGSGGREIARVELTWKQPDGVSSQRRPRATRSVDLSQLASSFVDSPLALQQAAITAHTAEVLRGSPFARVPRDARSLARVLEVAERTDSRLRERRSFVELIELIQQAEGVK